MSDNALDTLMGGAVIIVFIICVTVVLLRYWK